MISKKLVLVSGLMVASLSLSGCSSLQNMINDKIASTAKQVSDGVNTEVAKTTDALKIEGEKMQINANIAADQLKKEFREAKTYSNGQLSVDYPANFKAKEETFGKTKVVTISNEKGKIQIGDFEPDASPGPQPGMTQKQIDEFPKDIVAHGYDGKIVSALFYTTGDEQTAKILKEIQARIRLKGEVYKNTKFGFSLQFPKSWGKISVQETANKETMGVSVVSFSSEDKIKVYTLEVFKKEYTLPDGIDFAEVRQTSKYAILTGWDPGEDLEALERNDIGNSFKAL